MKMKYRSNILLVIDSFFFVVVILILILQLKFTVGTVEQGKV